MKLLGLTSHCIRARALLSSIPQAGALLADRKHNADSFCNALTETAFSPCIPSRLGRKVQGMSANTLACAPSTPEAQSKVRCSP